MWKKLDASNTMELAEYEASVAMYLISMAEWNALPLEGRGPAPVDVAPAALLAKTLYQNPLEQSLKLFSLLFLERSPGRIEEYRDFMPLPGASTQFGELFRPAPYVDRRARAAICHQTPYCSLQGHAHKGVGKILLALHGQRTGLSIVPLRLCKRLSGMPQSCRCTWGGLHDLVVATTISG
jgi:hypothetical protein